MKGYLPLIWLLVAAFGVLLTDLFRKPGAIPWAFRMGMGALLGVCIVYIGLYQEKYGLLLEKPGQHFLMNPWILKLSLWSSVVGLLVMIQSGHALVKAEIPIPEYTSLFLFALMGNLVLISAGSLLTLYLGLELMSLPAYAMVAMAQARGESDHAHEASMKYFVLGVLASGLILYGFSLLYGLTGTLDLDQITHGMPASTPDVAPMAFLAAVLVLAGLGFKLGIAPFHMWLPDVYQGAPAVVTLFIATLPKLAVFSFVLKMMLVWPVSAALRHDLSLFLLVVGVLSVWVGNLGALFQTHVRRMLAYSAIAHAGFLFLGLMVWFSAGAGTAFANVPIFYMLAYVLSALSAFGLVLYLSTVYGWHTLDDFKGLYRLHPGLAFLFLITFLSLAGIPPLLGFYAKLYVLGFMVRLQHIPAVVAVVLGSVVGAYYYLRMIWYIYFCEAERPAVYWRGAAQAQRTTGFSLGSVTGVLGLQAAALLFFGIFPAFLLEWLAFP